MPSSEAKTHGVWLHGDRVGTLYHRADRTRFVLDRDYIANPDRPVLGLLFEQDLHRAHAGQLRLPAWFSNLLPEGRLRQWIAQDRGVSAQREMELLLQVGHDLPGAVRVFVDDETPADPTWEDAAGSGAATMEDHGIRFSLAGVAMKFSMLCKGDRLTMPAHGEGGDWIVKLPDGVHDDVPRNEYAMMSLAASVGIEVPEVRLVHRSKFDGLPEGTWPGQEEWAYAIRRFDRDENRGLVHMEDLAQVRDFYAERKYTGTYETVASLVYRRHDRAALEEFARRLTFSILISNGDAHLKNWSLLYRDPKIPTLSPAYDLVCTSAYPIKETPEDLALKFGGTKAFHEVSLRTFARLQERLGATGADLPGCAAHVVEQVQGHWPAHAGFLGGNQRLQDAIHESIKARGRTLLRSTAR